MRNGEFDRESNTFTISGGNIAVSNVQPYHNSNHSREIWSNQNLFPLMLIFLVTESIRMSENVIHYLTNALYVLFVI